MTKYETHRDYKKCPVCGTTLDFVEKCECEAERKAEEWLNKKIWIPPHISNKIISYNEINNYMEVMT